MRPALVLSLFLVACAPPAASVARPMSEGGENTSNHREPTDRAAIIARDPDEALAGRWALTHGGLPWLELEIALHPGLSAHVVAFDPNGSWTEFAIVRVKLGDTGALELTGQYSQFPQTVEIALELRGGALTGTATGETYSAPEPVTGQRIP